jgi:hypothetical protein
MTALALWRKLSARLFTAVAGRMPFPRQCASPRGRRRQQHRKRPSTTTSGRSSPSARPSSVNYARDSRAAGAGDSTPCRRPDGTADRADAVHGRRQAGINLHIGKRFSSTSSKGISTPRRKARSRKRPSVPRRTEHRAAGGSEQRRPMVLLKGAGLSVLATAIALLCSG